MPASRRKATNLKLLVLVIVIIIVCIVAFNYPASKPEVGHTTFTFNNSTYKFTSVAVTLQQQEQGLMNSTVNGSTFELFVFSKPSIYPFWMKDTYYPLDIIWINGTTVAYIANAIPCSSYSKNQTTCILYNDYNGGHEANYVIEAQSGFVSRTGMHVGSSVYIH